jgi:hypothetical protein
MAVGDKQIHAGDGTASRSPARGRPVLAAVRAIEKNTIRLDLPGGIALTLPPREQLAFYGGLATIAALGIIEWPLATVLAVGHLLVQDQHHRLLHDFGQALSEA